MTSPWNALLDDVKFSEPDLGSQTAFVPLPSLGVIRLSGPESVKFLQGQTTADFRDVETGLSRRGAICSLKGRVLFSFIAIPHGDNILLVLPGDQMEAAMLHLKKYAVFSKTTLIDASASLAVLGVLGAEADGLISTLVGAMPEADKPQSSDSGAVAVRIGTESRYLAIAPAALASTLFSEKKSQMAAENLWWHAEINAGLATVSASTRDLFQPQELNFHATGAVSYNKGCYTGQEVVARLYFRGKLKQRLYHLRGDSDALPTSTAINREGLHVGDIVMAVRKGRELHVLAVVKNVAVREGNLHCDAGLLACEPLPYTLPAEKEE